MSDEDDYGIIDKEFYDEHLGPPKDKKEDPQPEIDEKSIDEDFRRLLSKEITDEFSKKENDGKSHLEIIFKPEHDSYQSAKYFEEQKKILLNNGFMEGPAFDQYLNAAVHIRILHISSKESQKSRIRDGLTPEDPQIISMLKSYSTILERALKSLIEQRNAMRSGADIHDLHQKEIEENAKFVKDNIGLFSFRCGKCNTIVSSGGLPHWAFKNEKDDLGDPIYHVWSDQLFYMVNNGLIEVYQMAFALQTSIEGIKVTAEIREQSLPTFDIIQQEKKLLDLMNKYEH